MAMHEPNISPPTVISTAAQHFLPKGGHYSMVFLIQSVASHRSERGQGLAEYALILALIAVLAIAAVTFLGSQINAILSDVGNSI